MKRARALRLRRSSRGTAWRPSVTLWVMLAIVLASAITCGPTTQGNKLDDPWFQDVEDGPRIDGNLDKAEARWREEIERERVDDDANMRRLMNDPPSAPGDDARITSDQKVTPRAEADELDAQGEEVAEPSFWSTAGKITFAALTVFVTLGMMAAPYLLMI